MMKGSIYLNIYSMERKGKELREKTVVKEKRE